MYRGLRKWAHLMGLNYDDLVVRSAGPDGDILSISDRVRSIVEDAVRE